MDEKKDMREDVIEEIQNEELSEEVKNEELLEKDSQEASDINESDEKNEGEGNPLKFIKNLKDENKKLKNEVDTLKDRLLRMTAEYDNYRKRTAKEKEGIYTEACTDVLKEILPVLDNLERALLANGNVDDVKKGIEMTIKGVSTSFEKLGVEEIDASGEFDPNLHQAVMHIEDEDFEKNSVAEVFQKGYKRGEKVIRYTMVKVAN